MRVFSGTSQDETLPRNILGWLWRTARPSCPVRWGAWVRSEAEDPEAAEAEDPEAEDPAFADLVAGDPEDADPEDPEDADPEAMQHSARSYAPRLARKNVGI